MSMMAHRGENLQGFGSPAAAPSDRIADRPTLMLNTFPPVGQKLNAHHCRLPPRIATFIMDCHKEGHSLYDHHRARGSCALAAQGEYHLEAMPMHLSRTLSMLDR